MINYSWEEQKIQITQLHKMGIDFTLTKMESAVWKMRTRLVLGGLRETKTFGLLFTCVSSVHPFLTCGFLIIVQYLLEP